MHILYISVIYVYCNPPSLNAKYRHIYIRHRHFGPTPLVNIECLTNWSFRTFLCEHKPRQRVPFLIQLQQMAIVWWRSSSFCMHISKFQLSFKFTVSWPIRVLCSISEKRMKNARYLSSWHTKPQFYYILIFNPLTPFELAMSSGIRSLLLS